MLLYFLLYVVIAVLFGRGFYSYLTALHGEHATSGMETLFGLAGAFWFVVLPIYLLWSRFSWVLRLVDKFAVALGEWVRKRSA